MRLWLSCLVVAVFAATAARADEPVEKQLKLQSHAFTPATLEIPAGQKVKLIITNADPTPAEFESFELNREKIVPANGEVSVYVGPLDPGTYPFFDDFHRETKGQIVVK